MKRYGLIMLATVFLGAAGYAGDNAVQKELKLLDGTWSYASLERDGKQVPAEDVQKLVLIVKDGGYTIKSGDTVLGPGTLKVDPTKSPKSIDVTPSGGPNQGKTSLGIYQLDGDTLKTCLAPAGKARPVEFASTPGSGQSLGVLKRKKS